MIPHNRKDLTGLTYGRLTVISFAFVKNQQCFWECKCICGTIKNVSTGKLNNGTTKSCGCYSKENTSNRSTIHGLSKHPLYGIYFKIKERCYKKSCKAFKNYGAKGVVMCEEWLNNFEAFYKWAIENG